MKISTLGGVFVSISVLGFAAIAAGVPGTFVDTGSLHQARTGHTATLLRDGRVLVVGGSNGSIPIKIAELYDPATDAWSLTQNPLHQRAAHTATLLSDGRVLIAGGADTHFNLVANAEIYDPATASWSEAGTLNTPREDHTATLLPDGRVLIAGGTQNATDGLASAEIFNPARGVCFA
jgi:Kelch motif/Galactose oxidase, central domain